ncbi:MAG: Calx-beta domain-containing protein [Cyanobacteria bacterium J06642_3]
MVRFSESEPTVRFAEGKDFIDLTVGLDNLLYGLESYGKVSVYDPENLELIRSFTLQNRYGYRGIAVNQQGEIFSASWDDNIYYFDSQGNIVDVNQANTTTFTTRSFYDINISPDGKELIASDRSGLVALLTIEDQSLELQDVFGTGGNGAFVSFGATPTINETVLPVVSISDAEVLEGDNESTWMDFTVSLSQASNETVIVDVQSDTSWTQENNVYPNNFGNYNDFFATTETISFAPGETEKTFSVEVYGDLQLETEEQIFARVDSIISDNALIDEQVGIGTIFDNETNKPQLSISEGEAVEGTTLEFTISLDQPLNDYVTVEAYTTTGYKTYYFDGRPTPSDAMAGEDYWSKSESFTFAPGETSKTFTVDTIADSLVEGAEQFPVKIATDDTNVYLKKRAAIGIIPDNDLVVGEVGYVEDITHLERTIQFQNEYENPVVIVSPLTRNGGNPAIARITQINNYSFSVFVQEPTLLRQQVHNGAHTRENFSYLVIEAGSWTMPDGSVLEAGLTEVDMNARSANWDRIKLSSDFNSPTVLSSVQTYNNDELLRLRQRNGKDFGVDVALEKEEALVKTQYAAETVGYIALEAGQNQLFGDGINYSAGDSGRNVNHRWHQLGIDNYPYLFASINSYYGGDSVGLRYQMGSVKIEEDTSFDNEMGHVKENVAYLGFDSLGTIVAEI